MELFHKRPQNQLFCVSVSSLSSQTHVEQTVSTLVPLDETGVSTLRAASSYVQKGSAASGSGKDVLGWTALQVCVLRISNVQIRNQVFGCLYCDILCAAHNVAKTNAPFDTRSTHAMHCSFVSTGGLDHGVSSAGWRNNIYRCSAARPDAAELPYRIPHEGLSKVFCGTLCRPVRHEHLTQSPWRLIARLQPPSSHSKSAFPPFATNRLRSCGRLSKYPQEALLQNSAYPLENRSMPCAASRLGPQTFAPRRRVHTWHVWMNVKGKILYSEGHKPTAPTFNPHVPAHIT